MADRLVQGTSVPPEPRNAATCLVHAEPHAPDADRCRQFRHFAQVAHPWLCAGGQTSTHSTKNRKPAIGRASASAMRCPIGMLCSRAFIAAKFWERGRKHLAIVAISGVKPLCGLCPDQAVPAAPYQTMPVRHALWRRPGSPHTGTFRLRRYLAPATPCLYVALTTLLRRPPWPMFCSAMAHAGRRWCKSCVKSRSTHAGYRTAFWSRWRPGSACPRPLSRGGQLYRFFHLQPVGRYHLLWSDNVTDRMQGSHALAQTCACACASPRRT